MAYRLSGSVLKIIGILLITTVACTRDKSIPNRSKASDNRRDIITLNNVTVFQKPGCADHGLSKPDDMFECFSCIFKDTLKIDFCVFGNCCPDSNRFDYQYYLRGDTIKVTVSDTAASRCWCTCKYVISLIIPELQNDCYRFYCRFPDFESFEQCLYDEKIVRAR